MKQFALIAATCAVLAGCAAPAAKISTPFNEAQAAALMRPGNNTIKGSALLRQNGGGVVTCAGETVDLVPATEYAKQRFDHRFGKRTFASTLKALENGPPAYDRLSRQTRCNAIGAFTFDRVADGDFYLVTSVDWSSGGRRYGGYLANLVRVRGGQVKDIVLTDTCMGCE